MGAVPLHESRHLGRGGQERLGHVAVAVAEQAVQIGGRRLGGVGVLKVIARHPDPAPGQRSRAAEPLAALDQQHLGPGHRGGQGGCEAGGAAAGHDHVGRRRHRRRRHGAHPAAVTTPTGGVTGPIPRPRASRGRPAAGVPGHPRRPVRRPWGRRSRSPRGPSRTRRSRLRRGRPRCAPTCSATCRRRARDEAVAGPPYPLGRVLDRQRVGHVVGDAQPRRGPAIHDLDQVTGPAQVPVRAVLQADRDAERLGPGHQPGQALVQHRPHCRAASNRAQFQALVGPDSLSADRCGGAVVSSRERNPCRASAP